MKKIFSIFSAIVLLFSLTVFAIPEAEARFGGGHSSGGHSSGSHSSSSSHSSSWGGHSSSSSHSSSHSYSGSSNDDDSAFWFFFTIIIIFIVLYILWVDNNQQPQTVTVKRPVKRFDENKLITFKQMDANFSRILFLDFVHLLYVKYHSYYGKKGFNYLIPYLDNTVQHDKKLDLLINQKVIVISEIVINSINFHSIGKFNNEDRIVVDIESNYSIHPAFHTQDSGKQHTRYTNTERWFFQRKQGTLSSSPEKMQALVCPACGAPAHFSDVGGCGSCKTVIVKGQQQWYVKERYLLNQTVLNSSDLVSYAAEEGTKLTTITSPTLLQEIAMFESHCTVVWSDYWPKFKQDIVERYFVELNTAWTQRNLNKVRHLVSDRLYEANSFWMDLYQHQGFHNYLDNVTIEKIHLAKIEHDIYYESITVRVFASCFDYTLDRNQQLIGGSNKKYRIYSEYWTFARRTGRENTQIVQDLNVCPQCAAPADKMGQAAVCGYCGTKISTGDFSWVLFLIMQDENYVG